MPKETVMIKKMPSYYFVARGLNEKEYLCVISDFTLTGLDKVSNSLMWERGRKLVIIYKSSVPY